LATTGIASWDASVKGIDDAVVRNLPITSISVQRWLDRLSPRFQQIAMARLSEITEISLSARNRRGRKGNEWSGCSNVQSSWELQYRVRLFSLSIVT